MTEAGARSASWQTCAIAEIIQQTPSIKSYFLRLSEPFAHTAGQHVDVRLTASDGYVAMRSYSIASAPSASSVIELTIERLPDGEVSPFFHDIAAVGDEIELRGPFGRHFVWPERATGPILLIGAGSGVVPLMAMIRQRRVLSQTVATALLLSTRTRRDVLFADELLASEMADPKFMLALAITRERAERASDFARRIDSAMVADLVARLPSMPTHVFVCGSNPFVNVASDATVMAGLGAAVIKTERYGG
ncbi:oxidoreductase [Bradyrhizobium nanningense]|uniref:Oxidoreductase n=1 Tax=Bradyrhizobium nanningense TaxID=1325118 RepID=A0A4Q0RY40_9BRAD|nr:FAD-binding oxidoreductase [Bradyrhizobium nanningense]RXH24146.1 oxidoreductase [Bradyrhizobium nanningense]RXH29297.1 oxidoreductase [Bradyrhizobium nanningense]